MERVTTADGLTSQVTKTRTFLMLRYQYMVTKLWKRNGSIPPTCAMLRADVQCMIVWKRASGENVKAWEVLVSEDVLYCAVSHPQRRASLWPCLLLLTKAVPNNDSPAWHQANTGSTHSLLTSVSPWGSQPDHSWRAWGVTVRMCLVMVSTAAYRRVAAGCSTGCIGGDQSWDNRLWLHQWGVQLEACSGSAKQSATTGSHLALTYCTVGLEDAEISGRMRLGSGETLHLINITDRSHVMSRSTTWQRS